MSDEARFSLTTKINGDLFTVRGDEISEFITHLKEAQTAIDSIKALLQVANNVPSSSSASVAKPAVAQTLVQVDDPFGSAAPTTTAPQCIHGPRKWKEGTGANGPYKGWVCQNPDRATQCKAQWVK